MSLVSLTNQPLSHSLSPEARVLARGMLLGATVLSLWPDVALAGLDTDLDSTSKLVFNKLVPIILGVGCVVGCGYSIIKSSLMGVVGSLGTTAIAGYTLNAIQSGAFLKLLGGGQQLVGGQ